MAADWSTIESLPQTPLLDLFANDPNRLASLSLDVAGIHFDWSKTHLTPEAVAAFVELAKAKGLAAKRDAARSSTPPSVARATPKASPRPAPRTPGCAR